MGEKAAITWHKWPMNGVTATRQRACFYFWNDFFSVLRLSNAFFSIAVFVDSFHVSFHCICVIVLYVIWCRLACIYVRKCDWIKCMRDNRWFDFTMEFPIEWSKAYTSWHRFYSRCKCVSHVPQSTDGIPFREKSIIELTKQWQPSEWVNDCQQQKQNENCLRDVDAL